MIRSRSYCTFAAALLAGAVLASQVQAKSVARYPYYRTPTVAPYVALGFGSMWGENLVPLRYQPWNSCTYRGGPKSIDWSCN